MSTNVTKLKAVKLLGTNDPLYIVTTSKHHVAIYSNNTAIVSPHLGEVTPFVLVKTKKGWIEQNDNDLFSTVERKLVELKLFLSPCQPSFLNVSPWLPKSKVLKSRGFLHGGTNHPLFSWVLLVAAEGRNILEFLTDSAYDTETITYVENPHLPDNYTLINSWLDTYQDFSLLSVDCETFDPIDPGGWRALSHRHCNIRSIQLWIPKAQQGLFIDFGMREFNMYSKEVSDRLTTFFIGKSVVFHNALFDLGVMEWQMGITLERTRLVDTQVLSQNLWAGVRIMTHNLGAVAKRFGIPINKDLQTSDFGAPLIPAQIQYGMDDTKVTAEVMQHLSKRLNTDCGNIIGARIDCQYLHTLQTMRMKGFPVDIGALDAAIETMTNWLEKKAAEFYDITGEIYTAREKVLAALQRLYPNAHITSTNKAELSSKGHLPAVQLLTDCKFAGVRLAYAKAVKSAITPDGTACGGFRPLANQGMGRTACTAKVGGKSGVFVQLQNPAKADKRYAELPDLRTVFKGGFNKKRGVKRSLVILDLSAAHLRLSHDFSNELEQIKLCNTPGSDSHSYNAAIVVQTALAGDAEYEGLNTYPLMLEAYKAENKTAKKVRDLSKNAIYTKINFGSAWSLQATIKKFGNDVDFETCELAMEGIGEAIPEWIQYCKKALKEANTFSYDFSSLYKSVEQLREDFIEDGVDDPEELDELIAEVTKKRPSSFGYAIAPSGRGRYVPKFMRDGKFGNYESAKLPDVSAHILQSTEADIMKVAGSRFHEWSRLRFINEERDVDCWLAVIAHDEYVIVVDEDYAEEAGRKMHSLLAEEGKKYAPRVPLVKTWTNKEYIKDNWSEK
jgi:3'-5' exonuclease